MLSFSTPWNRRCLLHSNSNSALKIRGMMQENHNYLIFFCFIQPLSHSDIRNSISTLKLAHYMPPLTFQKISNLSFSYKWHHKRSIKHKISMTLFSYNIYWLLFIVVVNGILLNNKLFTDNYLILVVLKQQVSTHQLNTLGQTDLSYWLLDRTKFYILVSQH